MRAFSQCKSFYLIIFNFSATFITNLVVNEHSLITNSFLSRIGHFCIQEYPNIRNRIFKLIWVFQYTKKPGLTVTHFNKQTVMLTNFFYHPFRPGGKATFDAEALVIKAQMVHKEVPKSNGHQPVKVNIKFHNACRESILLKSNTGFPRYSRQMRSVILDRKS